MRESTAQLIRDTLEAVLLFGGLLVALWMGWRERRNPPDGAALSATITERSWSAVHVVGLFAVFFALYLAAGCVGLFFYEEQLPVVRLFVTYAVYGTLLLFVALVSRARRRGGAPRMGLGGGHAARGLTLAPLFYLAAIPFILLISKGWHELISLLTGAEVELQEVARVASGSEWSGLKIATVFTAIFIAPIYEEVIFRGVLFPWFMKRAGLVGGVVATSILFALLHSHAPSLVPLTLLSVTTCLAYWRTGSLWTSIGVHVIFNAVTIVALNLAR